MLYDFTAGTTPLLVNVPHAGTEVPDAIERRFTPRARTLPDTDWHVHRLVARASALGASVLSARLSRYVIDLNRGRDDQPLYSGATTGLVPTVTFDGDPIYAQNPPDAEAQRRRIDTYWQPYHDKIRTTLEALRDRFGYAVVFDVHSIRSSVPRLFEGRLPDLNLGSNDGQSCAPSLQAMVAECLDEAEGFSSVVNGRFKGGFITRHYGRPEDHVHAVQLEIAQSCYMDEATPGAFSETRARPLVQVLEPLIERLARWRP